MANSSNDILVRHALPEDLPKLGEVETSAAEIFRAANLSWITESEPMDLDVLHERLRHNHVWVAVPSDKDNQPVGFAVVDPKDNRFYLAELSVHKEWQRKGIGMRLISTIELQAKVEGFSSLSLTTYRDLDWNGPFYARAGFREVDLFVSGIEHTKEIEEQGRHGHDVSRRCAMIKDL
jgi:GNAT superfamily N-acetyltransferase